MEDLPVQVWAGWPTHQERVSHLDGRSPEFHILPGRDFPQSGKKYINQDYLDNHYIVLLPDRQQRIEFNHCIQSLALSCILLD